jgi:hypothetical protein
MDRRTTNNLLEPGVAIKASAMDNFCEPGIAIKASAMDTLTSKVLGSNFYDTGLASITADANLYAKAAGNFYDSSIGIKTSAMDTLASKVLGSNFYDTGLASITTDANLYAKAAGAFYDSSTGIKATAMDGLASNVIDNNFYATGLASLAADVNRYAELAGPLSSKVLDNNFYATGLASLTADANLYAKDAGTLFDSGIAIKATGMGTVSTNVIGNTTEPNPQSLRMKLPRSDKSARSRRDNLLPTPNVVTLIVFAKVVCSVCEKPIEGIRRGKMLLVPPTTCRACLLDALAQLDEDQADTPSAGPILQAVPGCGESDGQPRGSLHLIGKSEHPVG